MKPLTILSSAVHISSFHTKQNIEKQICLRPKLALNGCCLKNVLRSTSCIFSEFLKAVSPHLISVFKYFMCSEDTDFFVCRKNVNI